MQTLARKIRKEISGLQFRTTVLLTLVVMAASGLTGVTYLRITSQMTVEQSKKYASDMARALAKANAHAIEQGDRSKLLSIVEESVPGSELCYIFFTDVKGQVLASHQQGAGNITDLMLEDARNVSVEPIDRPRLLYNEVLGPRIDLVYPVHSTVSVLKDGELHPTVGYVRLGVSLGTAQLMLASMTRNVIGLAIGITLLMVPVGYEVVRNLIGPLKRLRETARTFASGSLEARVEVNRRDEIGELATAFNGMADELASSQNKLVSLNAELEDRVAQRTRDLEDANTKLREMAIRDSLTGLYNRRHFNDLLNQLFAESSRYHTDLTCMMIDLDNFKRVNDSLGHQTGDQLLRMTADVLTHCIREADVAIRYGGDEFIVLLPQTTPEEARRSAERVLNKFRSELSRIMPEASIVSLSIGLASRQEDQPTEAMQLVRLADEALYLAKAGGKNRITVVQPVVGSAEPEVA